MRLLFSLTLASFLALPAFAQTPAPNAKMTSLNAVPREKQVLLSWTPENMDVKSYQIEKSKNGSDFVMFSTVEGSAAQTEFLETDFTPFTGLSYYRITATAVDGSVLYSNVVPVKYGENGSPVSPVPATAYNENSSHDKSVLVIVRSSGGDEFYSKVEVQSSGNPVQCKDPDPTLAKGTYTIVGCSEQDLYSRQMIVQ